MDNVISLKGFQFQDHKRGWKHLRKDLENSSTGESDLASFVFRQVGNFIRLARLKKGHSLEEAAHLFGVTVEDFVAFEQGTQEVEKKLLVGICTKYHVKREFEEFEIYLRGALHPEERKSFAEARPLLEKMGFIDRRDW